MYSDYRAPMLSGLRSRSGLEQKYEFECAAALPASHQRQRPAQRLLRVQGQYSYLDARRWANLRGRAVIKGPLKVYDTMRHWSRPVRREGKGADGV